MLKVLTAEEGFLSMVRMLITKDVLQALNHVMKLINVTKSNSSRM